MELTRRRVLGATSAAMLAAPALAPGGAAGAIIQMLSASRLTPPSDTIYEPPLTLKGVADLYRRMTAPVEVEGKGPFPFVVDTGANQSVISAEVARRLDLPLAASRPLNGIAGVDMAPTLTAMLRLGRRDAGPATLSVLPGAALGAAGLLGMDQLGDCQLVLDFHDEVLEIDPADRRTTDPGDVTVKARRRDGQLTLVDADLAGIAITAFLDSGAQNTIGNMVLRGMAVTRHPQTPWSATTVVSATGQTIAADMAELPDLRLGGVRLPNWPVAFADLHTFEMWDLVRRPAILVGVDILTRFQSVCLDFARDEVRFRPAMVQS